MTRVRRRMAHGHRSGFLPLEAEALGEVRTSDYVWPLSKYLLPWPGRDLTIEQRRRAIETARDHETRMWSRYPDGPDSVPTYQRSEPE